MAAITLPAAFPNRAQPNASKTPAEPRALTALEMLALPLLRFVQPGRRAEFELNAELARRAAQQRASERELKKELLKEAKLYEQIIVTRWAALGAYHRPHTQWDGPEKIHKKLKVHRVQFEYIGVTPETMFYKILTRRRAGLMGLFGAQNALPADVRVLDLISEETLNELSYACHRRVRMINEDPRFGVWIAVDRLAGMDGLPNKVPFTGMLEHYPIEHIEKAPLILGVGKHRQVQVVYLADHPHVLIAGSSGGGKSNMVNNIISQLMWFTDPESIKFTLIDLKRMEFGMYIGSPHLSGPVIFTAEDAIKALNDLITEVLRRADILSGKAKELSVWNKRFPDERMPRLVVVIDEFAELMLASGRQTSKTIEDLVTRLVNLGRAVGVHAIICTQRPAVAVLPNSIKINMPLIISGRTQSAAQSSVIVDNADAANLPLDPKGRMIYLSGSQRQEIQTPFIDDDDVRTAVRIANGRAAKVIRLSGYDPVIVPEGLTEWINANEDGWLSGKTAFKLQDFAINAKMFKGYGDDLTSAGQTEKFGKVWRLKQPKVRPAPVVTHVQHTPAVIEPPTLEAAVETVPPAIVEDGFMNNLTPNQFKVLGVIVASDAVSLTEILKSTGLSTGSTSTALGSLSRKKLIQKSGSKYAPTSAGKENLSKIIAFNIQKASSDVLLEKESTEGGTSGTLDKPHVTDKENNTELIDDNAEKLPYPETTEFEEMELVLE
jgi:hypothetical protein